jgi:hypothetical protein
MAYGAGGVIILPGDQPHFHWARSGEYVTQVTTIGSLGLAYVHAAHDPRLRRRSSDATAEAAKNGHESIAASGNA